MILWKWIRQIYTKVMSNIEDALKKASVALTRRDQLNSIYHVNMAAIDDLIVEIKRLNDEGRTKESGRLIEIAQAILDNNVRYRDLVIEVMKESEGR